MVLDSQLCQKTLIKISVEILQSVRRPETFSLTYLRYHLFLLYSDIFILAKNFHVKTFIWPRVII